MKQLGGPPASRKGGDMGRAGRLSVESSGDAAGTQARDRIEGNGRLRYARGDGRRQEAGSVRRVKGWVAPLGQRFVRRALDDFRSGPLFLTCNALGQTAVMPGHLVEYNSSIAGEE